MRYSPFCHVSVLWVVIVFFLWNFLDKKKQKQCIQLHGNLVGTKVLWRLIKEKDRTLSAAKKALTATKRLEAEKRVKKLQSRIAGLVKSLHEHSIREFRCHGDVLVCFSS